MTKAFYLNLNFRYSYIFHLQGVLPESTAVLGKRLIKELVSAFTCPLLRHTIMVRWPAIGGSTTAQVSSSPVLGREFGESSQVDHDVGRM